MAARIDAVLSERGFDVTTVTATTDPIIASGRYRLGRGISPATFAPVVAPVPSKLISAS